MKFLLHKRSVPGWTKEFDSRKACAKELRSHLCRECFRGEYALVGGGIHKVKPPKLDNLDSLLGTSCGLEDEVEIIS